MRSTAADRCWQEARSVLMELFYQGSTSHDGRYFIFVRMSRGRHISQAASGKERQDEMEYQPWVRHARQELRNDEKRDFARGSRRRIGIREGTRERGVARDTQRPVGIICTSLEWRWLRLIGTCANACHVVHRSRAVNLQANAGLWIFSTNTRFNRLLFSLTIQAKFHKFWREYSTFQINELVLIISYNILGEEREREKRTIFWKREIALRLIILFIHLIQWRTHFLDRSSVYIIIELTYIEFLTYNFYSKNDNSFEF